MSGGTVYAGGLFTRIGGQPRNYIAALDAASGAATAWNPNANDHVSALAVSGDTIYAGGYFTSIGGEPRNRIAALDAASGAATAWNPSADEYVLALAVGGGTVYAGGNFTNIGGHYQPHFAAISADHTTPALAALVSAEALPGRVAVTWYVGDADHAAVYRREKQSSWTAIGVAELDGWGAAKYVDVGVEAGTEYGYCLGIAGSEGEVLSGEVWVTVPSGYALALEGARPNPAVEGLQVSFSLPDARLAELAVFDVAGRQVLSRKLQGMDPGQHVIALDGEARLAPGVYVVRLTHGGRSLTARAVVIR